MNESFNGVLDKSGLSMYELSQRSGVPYTTINEIHNGVNDINRCSAGTVWRLGVAFGKDPGSLLNEIRYLDGVGGRYKGISYIWRCDDTSKVLFSYAGEDVILDTGKMYDIPDRIDYYRQIAKWMISDYIETRKWEREADALYKGAGNREE